MAVASDQYQSTVIRQDVNNLLGLADIRMSIDSSDVPHLHWQRALVDRRIKQHQDDTLTLEVQQAVHDYRKRRVLKSKKSSDDVMQAVIGSFYLSDTEGRQNGSIEDLYGSDRVNLIGGNSIGNVLKNLGYN